MNAVGLFRVQELLLHARKIPVRCHAPDVVCRARMGGETEDVGRVAGLVEGSGVLRRAAALHFAGDEAVTQELWGGVDAEAVVGKGAEIAPRLLIE